MESRQTEERVTGSIPNGKSESPAAEEGPQNPARRRIAIVGGAIVLLALLLWGLNYFAYARTHESTDDARIDAPTTSVTSKITERVDAILVDTGQPVRRGQLLIQLDSRDELSRLQQAQAAVTAQRAQAVAAQSNVALTQQTVAAQAAEGAGGIQQAQSGISSAQSNVSAAHGQVDVAAAGVDAAQAAVPAAQQAVARAQADLQRTRSLVISGDLPRAQLDAARAGAAAAASQYAEALANVAAARNRVAAAQALVGGAASGVGSAQGSLQTAQGKYQEAASPSRIAASQAQANAALANVASIQAQLQLAKDQLNYTRVRSPIDGYVGAKNVEVGQTIGPGTPLISIIPSRNVFVTANYKETQVGRMRVGQNADIKVDAYKGTVFRGHVAAINPASQSTYALIPAQNASGNFIKVTQRIPVKIVFDHPPANFVLRPGMSVETAVQVK